MHLASVCRLPHERPSHVRPAGLLSHARPTGLPPTLPTRPHLGHQRLQSSAWNTHTCAPCRPLLSHVCFAICTMVAGGSAAGAQMAPPTSKL
eukprot:1146016-Pelagomonas_calceolata.AAC.7